MDGFSTHKGTEDLYPIYFSDAYVSVYGNNKILNFKNNRFIYITSLTNGLSYSFRQRSFGSH